jgi:hypothetical protein
MLQTYFQKFYAANVSAFEVRASFTRSIFFIFFEEPFFAWSNFLIAPVTDGVQAVKSTGCPLAQVKKFRNSYFRHYLNFAKIKIWKA